MIDIHPVDTHVGSRLREARVEAGLTQTQLAKSAKVSFQQLQKYENGVNRVSASRLYMLSSKLNKPVQYFFEGLENTTPHG